jgi:hypothetical protein
MLMGRKRRETAEECTRNAQEMPLAWGGYIIRPTDRRYADIREAPNTSGIYAWYAKNGYLMYVGRSVQIATRLRQHQMTSFTARPSLFSFLEVPDRLIAAVEGAHIRVLAPIENRAGESRSTSFQKEMEAAIEAEWRDVLPVQTEWLDAAYSRIMAAVAEGMERDRLARFK